MNNNQSNDFPIDKHLDNIDELLDKIAKTLFTQKEYDQFYNRIISEDNDAPEISKLINLDTVDNHLQNSGKNEDYRDGYSDGIIYTERFHNIRGKYE